MIGVQSNTAVVTQIWDHSLLEKCLLHVEYDISIFVYFNMMINKLSLSD